MAAIRTTGKFITNMEERRKTLDEMGFTWRLRSGSDAEVEFPMVLDGLKAYKDQFGNVDVPPSFVIPDVEPWPETVRGLPLGSKVREGWGWGRDPP